LCRPHKRKRATCLKGKCVEYVGDNLHAVFEAGVLDIKLRVQILEYLCENPVLVDLPDGFLDESWTKLCLGGCVLPKGILAQVGEQCYDLEELDLKQCSGHEMLDVESFAALCDGCRQLKTMDLTGIMTLKDKQLECMHHLGSSLRRVRLGGNICLSSSAIATFLQKAGNNLQELDLSGCQVNDEVAQAISAHCKNLQDLSIGYADMADGGTAGGGISRMGWALLIRSLRKVHSLRIKRVLGVGKPLLLLIARHLGQNLTFLDITGLKDIKADETVYLMRCCPNLEYLNVKNCIQLPPDFLDSSVAKLLPKLKTFERDRARFDPTQALKD
jgi:hypothetical protein